MPKKNNIIKNKIFSEIKIGDTAHYSRKLTQNDIELFAIMSGDINPAHLDSEYAKSDIFHKIVAHGMWGGSLISAVLGTKLPGPGTIYLKQTLKFLRPVTVGDTITARVTVSKKYARKPILDLRCECVNQNSKQVITGIAKVLAPTEKVKRKSITLPQIIIKN